MQRNKIFVLIVVLSLILTGCGKVIDDFTTEVADRIIEKAHEPETKELLEEVEASSETTETELVFEPVNIQVHFVDVGQGDSIFIQTPSKNVLIDGGEKGSGIVDYLKKLNIETIDIVIGTHAHSDHIGGLIDVFERFQVKEVIDPGAIHTTKTYEDYLRAIDRKNIKFTEGYAGLTRDLGHNINLEILHPISVDGQSINNTSIVAKLTHHWASFLFTGDIEKEVEDKLVRTYNLDSTVLKVPHHGSDTSSSIAFIKAVNPKIAVIMVGGDNSYGHPDKDVLKRLENIDIYRTDLDGTIIITTNGEQITVKKEKSTTKSQAQNDITKNSNQEKSENSEGKININTATKEELMSLPGIGKVLAEEILKYRMHGRFDTIEEIMEVRGIGEARFNKIRDLITVE